MNPLGTVELASAPKMDRMAASYGLAREASVPPSWKPGSGWRYPGAGMKSSQLPISGISPMLALTYRMGLDFSAEENEQQFLNLQLLLLNNADGCLQQAMNTAFLAGPYESSVWVAEDTQDELSVSLEYLYFAVRVRVDVRHENKNFAMLQQVPAIWSWKIYQYGGKQAW